MDPRSDLQLFGKPGLEQEIQTSIYFMVNDNSEFRFEQETQSSGYLPQLASNKTPVYLHKAHQRQGSRAGRRTKGRLSKEHVGSSLFAKGTTRLLVVKVTSSGNSGGVPTYRRRARWRKSHAGGLSEPSGKPKPFRNRIPATKKHQIPTTSQSNSSSRWFWNVS